MRTTLVIKDPVYKRARKCAREKGVRLSALVTEATEEFLSRMQSGKKAVREPMVRLKPFAMGGAQADIDNREELCRKMEEL